MRINILTIIYCLFLTSFIACSKTNQRVAYAFKDVKPEIIEKDIHNFDKPSGNGIRITIPDVSEEESIQLSTIIDSISYVKLSNDPKAIIGAINKIEFSDTCMYILDRYKTKTLKVFNANGSFISQIGKRGEGPEEYNEITDFDITDKNIVVFDQFKQRMMFFDKSGNLLQTKKVPFTLIKFYCFTPNKYLFNTLDCDNDHLQSIVNNSIFESDSNFVLTHRGFFREKGLYRSYLMENDFSNKNDIVYYHPPYGDTIFSISKANTINIEYIFDFGKKQLPTHYLLNKYQDDFNKVSNENNYIFFYGNFFDLNNLVFFEFIKKHTVYKGIFSKASKKLILGNVIVNDVSSILLFDNILKSRNNTLIGYAQAPDILNMVPKDRNAWSKWVEKKHIPIIETMSIEDNPVILFYHFKKDI